MADTAHTPSRRVVLGAPLALAVIGTAAASCVAQPAEAQIGGKFARRLAAYRDAVAVYEAFYRQSVKPVCDHHDAMCHRYGRESQQASRAFEVAIHAESHADDLVVRLQRRLNILIFTPAPNHSALIAKLEAMQSDGRFERGNDNRAEIDTIIADVRLLGGEA